MNRTHSAILLFLFLVIFSGQSFAQMFWNQAAFFNASQSDFLSVPNSPGLNISSSFTIEAWLCPTDVTSATPQVIMQKVQGISLSGYGMVLTSGKPAIRVNGIVRLEGKTSLQANKWTHVCAVFDDAANTYSIYLDSKLDTSGFIPVSPASNSDSLLIGRGYTSSFDGLMDEIRVWNKDLTSDEIEKYYRSTLGVSSGKYSSLVMSLPFQDRDAQGTLFSLVDWSGNGNDAYNYGVSPKDLKYRPSTTIIHNDCLEFDGAGDYTAMESSTITNPVNEITMEAWIYPRTTSEQPIIFKCTPIGTSNSYRLSIFNRKLFAQINSGMSILSFDTIPINKWTHVAFTYRASDGDYKFVINGKLRDTGTALRGLITSTSDSLYIGGFTNVVNKFNGFIDEVRITHKAKSLYEICSSMYSSIEQSNDSVSVPTLSLNLDGYTVSNADISQRLRFRNDAGFAHAGGNTYKPVSPMLRADYLNFQKGFFIKPTDRRIPETGTSGSMTTDSMEIFLDEDISDMNIFVAVNHSMGDNLRFSLTGPDGSVLIFQSYRALSNESGNIVTVFNEYADSTNADLKYICLSPEVKPSGSPISTFGTRTCRGLWKMDILDNVAQDTGRLYAWGIVVNNKTVLPRVLNTNVIVQGFYNPATNQSIRDTIRCALRSSVSPYSQVELVKFYNPLSGLTDIHYSNATPGEDYYLRLRHRNSIETWSSSFVNFDPFTSQTEYRFNTSAAQAFGSNQIQVDNSPVRFAIYGGDVNQDDAVDASDLALIDNDATAFITGYVDTDLNGDDFVDATDYSLADNNATAFISVIAP